MKILLTIQYNGKNFCGWQVQPNKRTIQEVLESAISTLLGEKISLFASGRTDSGVHAIAQTAHFETTKDFDLKKLPFAINNYLNCTDVAVLSAKKVKNNFHARYDVKKKTYLYKLYASEINLPLKDDFSYKISPKILQNLEEMKIASKHFLGTHDFSAFCASKTNVKDFTRTIYDIKFKKNKQDLEIYISGNGFLYNMVRIIVGTLLEVGKAKINPNEIPNTIDSKNRKNAGKTLPAHALYLFKVNY